MNCPKCDSPCDRDEVYVGGGTFYGPWFCPNCYWDQGEGDFHGLSKELKGGD